MDSVWSLFTYDWIPINRTPICVIRLPDTHNYFRRLTVGQRDPGDLGRHNSGVEVAHVCDQRLPLVEGVETPKPDPTRLADLNRNPRTPGQSH